MVDLTLQRLDRGIYSSQVGAKFVLFTLQF